MDHAGRSVERRNRDFRTVVLADRFPLVLLGLKVSLAGLQAPRYVIVGEARESSRLAELAQHHEPDILILSLDLAGRPIDEVMMEVEPACPEMQVLVLSETTQACTLSLAKRFKFGALLLKRECTGWLPQALQALESGVIWLSPAVAADFWREPESDVAVQLSERERILLQAIAEGKENLQIANQLGLAPQTVRNYLSLVYARIGVTSRAEAITWARSHGFPL